MLDLFQIYTFRFERNGPNSTLQVDDHRKIVNTPDGERQLHLNIKNLHEDIF